MKIPTWLSVNLLVNMREETTYVELMTEDEAPVPLYAVFCSGPTTGGWKDWSKHAAHDPDMENASLERGLSESDEERLLEQLALANPRVADYLDRWVTTRA